MDRVMDWMTSDVLVVGPTTPAAECRQLMRERGIRNLPVVDEGALVGRVGDAAVFGRHETGAVAADLSTPAPIVASPDAPLRDVLARCAWSMQEAVFVVEAGRLVGILTEHDAVRHAADELPESLRVRDCATPEPFTMTVDRTTEDALFEMRRRFIRHMVLVDGERLVGVISQRDLLMDADVEGNPTRRPLGELVGGPVVWTVAWDDPVRDAADIMIRHGIGCLPVVSRADPSRVQAVLCRSDLIRAMLRWGLPEDWESDDSTASEALG